MKKTLIIASFALLASYGVSQAATLAIGGGSGGGITFVTTNGGIALADSWNLAGGNATATTVGGDASHADAHSNNHANSGTAGDGFAVGTGGSLGFGLGIGGSKASVAVAGGTAGSASASTGNAASIGHGESDGYASADNGPSGGTSSAGGSGGGATVSASGGTGSSASVAGGTGGGVAATN